MTLTDVLHPVAFVASIAAFTWWIAGRWIGGEKLILVSLFAGFAVAIGDAAVTAKDPFAAIVASLVATLAIYGGWRLKHFAQENQNV